MGITERLQLIRQRGPWRSLEAVELATLEWVAWYSNTRLLGPIGHISPVEFEERYHRDQQSLAMVVGLN